MCMKKICSALAVLSVFALLMSFSSIVHAMSSTTYEIRADLLGSGGGSDASSSTSYIIRDTVGVGASDSATSTSYDVSTGYRPQIFDQFATFELFIQDRSSQVAATALVGDTVTVTTASGISAGDMIAIVQDEGASQVTSIGEVIGTTGTTATIDFQTSLGGTPVIDGSSDLVYVLDASTISFGSVSDSVVTTGIIGWEVNVDNEDGYSVYVYEDDDFSNGSEDISDVFDGTVTAGVSEYGARSSDSSLVSSTFDSEDAAFSTTPERVGSRSGGEFKSRDFTLVKLGVSDTQEGGTYSHELTYVYVGDY